MRVLFFSLALSLLLPAAAGADDNPLPGYESQARAIQKECFAGWEALSPMEARERLEKGLDIGL